MSVGPSRSRGRSPWVEGASLDLLISLLGPVVDIQAGFPSLDVSSFVNGKADSVHEIQTNIDRPGFFAALRPVDGSIYALQQIRSNGGSAHLIAPASQSRWRSCRSDMYDWVESHLGVKWAESLIMTDNRAMIRGDRLLTSYAEVWDWNDPTWDRVVLDASHNRGVSGIRMKGWQDSKALAGDWFDRIPWVSRPNGDQAWNIRDSDHFSISIIRRREAYRLDVFVEMFDESTGFSAQLERGEYDVRPAANRPSRAGQLLLSQKRVWRVNGNVYHGTIESHDRFEWGGRGW